MMKMTAEDERALFDSWAKTRDIEARNALIEGILWVVPATAREFRCATAADRGELIAEGNLALLVAFEHFDRARNVRFATYARHWVYSAMSTYLARAGNALGTRSRTRLRSRVRDLSLDAPVSGAHGITLHDCLSAELPCADAAIDGARRRELLRNVLAEVRSSLDVRARTVLDDRLSQEDADDLKTVAERLGLSAERTRQIEGRVRSQLAARLRGALGAPQSSGTLYSAM